MVRSRLQIRKDGTIWFGSMAAGSWVYEPMIKTYVVGLLGRHHEAFTSKKAMRAYLNKMAERIPK